MKGARQILKIGSHPERKEDEIFLTTAKPHLYHTYRWHTKRHGETDGDGNWPIFVKKSEAVVAGFKVEG